MSHSEGATSTMSLDWLPTVGISLGSGALAWLVSWRVSDAVRQGRSDSLEKMQAANSAGLRQDLRDLRDEVHGSVTGFREEVRSALNELRGVTLLTSKLQASQDVVNNVTARAIEGITDKVDRLETVTADHSSSLKLITELVTRRTGNRCILDTSEEKKA